jgi:hypothetical protein
MILRLFIALSRPPLRFRVSRVHGEPRGRDGAADARQKPSVRAFSRG